MVRRRYDRAGEEAVKLERSSVHILRTDQELREAVERASEFEKRMAETLRSRSKHYRDLVTDLLDGEAV